MTHVTIKCPQCNKILHTFTGTAINIGNPFHQCPYCREIYIHQYVKEWENMTPAQRFFIINSKAPSLAVIGFISGMVVGFTSAGVIQVYVLALVISIIGAGIGFLIGMKVKKNPKIIKDINDSIIRTRDLEYRDKLIKAGIQFFPLNKTRY